jgi:hypothetical protein
MTGQGIGENKISEIKIKRRMICLRENRKVEGQYFLDRLTRKNRSIKRMKENIRKATGQEGSLQSGLQKEEKQIEIQAYV